MRLYRVFNNNRHGMILVVAEDTAEASETARLVGHIRKRHRSMRDITDDADLDQQLGPGARKGLPQLLQDESGGVARYGKDGWSLDGVPMDKEGSI